MFKLKNLKEKDIFYISIAMCILLTVILYFFGQSLVDINHLPDTGASWYYWKLPKRDSMAQITAWVFYGLHQGTVWYFIYKISKLPKEQKNKFGKYNYYLLLTNLIFIVLHFIQTYIWYDGLAQDVSVFSSQISVIFMLVIILIMENRRRGLFFGKKVKLPKDGVNAISKCHGIYISWAIVYTFWYHPMEGVAQHLLGFLYMFLLFIQMSFANTKTHYNRWWIFTLEVMVLIHGTIVAIMNKQEVWSMFLFGFGFMMVVTQIYGLGLKIETIIRISLIYVALAIGVYAAKGIGNIHQIVWIPVIEYGFALLTPWVFEIFIRLYKFISNKNKVENS